MGKYQRNKYLDDLGLDIKNYGTNFVDELKDDRKEKWKEQRKKYGFDEREIWNLDTIFVEWLYSHLMMYKEKASQIIDLSYHKVEWENKEITSEDAIDKIINIAKEVLIAENYDKREVKYNTFCKYMELYAKILPSLWY